MSLESIKLPNNEGMTVVNMIPAVSIDVAKIAFSYVTSMTTERYISTIGVSDYIGAVPLSSLLVLFDDKE